MQQFSLVSFDVCPYVERSRIVFFEKGRDFDEELIDLENKPQWFLELSPRGKVPVLVLGGDRDHVIFESSVINELLEELFPAPAMMPSDPVQRAEARSWIEFNNNDIMTALGTYLLAKGDPDKRDRARRRFRDAFEWVDARLARRSAGPYFFGEQFGLVDATYAPLFTRWQAMEILGETDLLRGLDSFVAYKDALLARPSVQRAPGRDLTEKTVARARDE